LGTNVWPDVSGLTTLDAALAYGRDQKVCGTNRYPETKKPGSCLGVGWPAKATIDPDIIRGWWQRWPDAGIGILTGRSGLVALDADIEESFAPALEGLREGLIPLQPLGHHKRTRTLRFRL